MENLNEKITEGFDIYDNDKTLEPFQEFIVDETSFSFTFHETKKDAISFLEFHSDSGIFFDEEIVKIFEEHEEEILKVLKKSRIDLKDLYNQGQNKINSKYFYDKDEYFLPSIDELKVLYFRNAWEKATEDIIKDFIKPAGNQLKD